ncbi:MAG: hypothetical protein HYZ58_15280 [Acidobacteria bacterium]|nr:hypothetical protein [Acidobacteriota bacterium]
MTVDFDMEHIPEPKERERSFYYDFLYSTFGLQVKEALDVPRSARKVSGSPKPASNVNCLAEVPDSSWFTNRHARQPLGLDALIKGPNRGSGPAPGVWAVVRGKTEGVTPGFLIRDARNEIYQLKFDPPSNPEMSTAAEVIASKLYYAAGYNVKENYLVTFDRASLALDPKATTEDRFGRKEPMTEAHLNVILSKVARRPDGLYRAVAGKYLDGIPKGPFAFEGVREDDPNDWVPHEHRRDLRGLRVLVSWINDNDFREGNTLDMYVEDEGRRFLRHYLIDAGSSLGSETGFANPDRIGHEYQLDLGQVAKSFFSLGLYRRPWKGSSRHAAYPSVGFLEADLFDPGRWRANYPILPFENMSRQDAFWGTRLVFSFTDEQIRALAETGEFNDPDATRFLADVLIRRRDKIARHWLSQVNPLDRFQVWRDAGGTWHLVYEDLELAQDLIRREDRRYEYSVRPEGPSTRLRTGAGRPLIARQPSGTPSVSLDGVTRDGSVSRVSLWSLHRGRQQGERIDVYLRTRSGRVELIGIDREE